MKTSRGEKLIVTLVGLLLVAVAVQSVVILKLYRRDAPVTPPSLSERSRDRASPPSATPFANRSFDSDAWDPFQEFRSMQHQMDQMFNDAFGRFQSSPDFPALWGETSFSPNMDLDEKKDRYIVRFDVPGVDASDISVDLNERELTISGTVDAESEHEDRNALRRERRSGRFKRSLTLPGAVNPNAMDIDYKEGVLIITIPKADLE